MPHAFRVGQLVALAQTSRDPETYEVMQLMPETPSGEPQYRIKGLSRGIVRAVREAEIKPTPEEPTPAPPRRRSARASRPAAWDQLKPDTNFHSSPKPTLICQPAPRTASWSRQVERVHPTPRLNSRGG